MRGVPFFADASALPDDFEGAALSPNESWASHPAAWSRRELLEREDWRWILDEGQVDELRTAVRHCEPYWECPEKLTRESFSLPQLARDLARIQERLEHGPGLAVIRGLPIDEWTAAQAACAFWGLCLHLGTPVPQTTAGVRIFNVRDERLPDGHPQARGPSSNRRLSFHTDRCDVIGFLCLQQALAGGDNDVVSSLRLYLELGKRRPDLVEILERPFLYQRHNVDLGNAHRYYELPVFSQCEGHFACFLLRVLIERAYAAADTPEMSKLQLEALDALAELAESTELRYEFRQQRGDVVLLNNLVTLHRRTEFQDPPEIDRRRHLMRIWLSMPNSRPLVPEFEPAFGDVAAGAIRGGMKPIEKS